MRQKIFRGAAILFCEAGVAWAAFAQTSPDSQTLQQHVMSSSPDITRAAAGAASGIQLNAATNSNQGSLNLGTSNPNGTNWAILLTSPLSMGSDSSGGSSANNANIATLNGLANGFSGTFKLNWFSFAAPKDGGDISKSLEQEAIQNCKNDLNTPVKADCDNEKTETTTGAPRPFIQKYVGRSAAEEYLNDHFSAPNGAIAYTWGIQAAVGYNSFTYYQPTNLAKSSEDDIPRSVGAHVGMVPGFLAFSAPTLIDIAANYQQSYKAMDSTTKCKTMGSAINCETGSIGAPQHMQKILLSLNANTQFDTGLKGLGQYVGLSPQFTYDVKNKQEGIDIPIYFISDSKGNLIGGITGGWTNTKHFTVGLIVGAPFSFFAQ
jgi:hypothetical protein